MFNLGRIVIGINIKDGDSVKCIKEVNEFKKYFKDEYLIYILKAYESGVLKQFFYGHGKDEISEMLEQAKLNGKPQFEVLNDLAKILGISEIKSESVLKNMRIFDKEILLDNLLENGGEIYLMADTYDFKFQNSKLLKNIFLRGSGLNKTLINIGGELYLDDDVEMIIENFDLKIIDSLKIENGKVIFRNVSIDGGSIDLTSTFAELDNVNVSSTINSYSSNLIVSSSKIFGGESLNLINSQSEIKNSQIYKMNGNGIDAKSSNVIVDNSEIYENLKNGIVIKESSTLTLTSSNIYKNGRKDEWYHQIWVENSYAEISDSRIFESKGGAGIYGVFAKIVIKNSEIYENSGRGISIRESSMLILMSSNIYKNGRKDEWYHQIWVENSYAEISDSKIHESKGGVGIYGNSAKIVIKNSEVYGNTGNGIGMIDSSTLTLTSSNIYENGMKDKSYHQIYVEKSDAEISDSRIFESKGGSGIYGESAKLVIKNSEVYENLGNGINIKESSTLTLISSNIYKNGTEGKSYPQIWVEKSDAEVSDSRIFESKGRSGIYGESGKLVIKNSEVYENLWYGIEIKESSTLTLTSSNIYKNRFTQIYIEKSDAEISDSKIYENRSEGDGIYCISSKIVIKNSEVFENQGVGINIRRDSDAYLYSVVTYKNKIGLKHYPSISKENCDFKDGYQYR
ncbi:right-handed parallel beta-helix repeat-containing protein [Calditerrivibrio nitroreducens]|uniref:Right handed beta helix domain-containing protein n=1 Tax=Calditerrivibrio nitroreducens (strain DSM 19672 / NBRC 101217 / Yu37-1) TaxID=768670 RepID=E4TKA0_CALNY|nr:right-handed parallel beta-helix repeat-containing protein [Calditerrivibrio nitroreducens]ADR19972.1 hypothetical protein Calni_2080 [Calditerrivibrio nitroreducens DSM 19672]